MRDAAAPANADCRVAGVASGCRARYTAATPAACGAAIDVPLMVRVAVSPVSQSDVMSTPGAYQSTHGPPSDHGAGASLRSLAATVMTPGTRAGDDVHASAPS